MGKQVAFVLSIAVVAAGAVFLLAGTINGRYPFGPDQRPMCGGTPEGIPPGCYAGPLGDAWHEPFLGPAILAFVLVVAVGAVILWHLGQSKRNHCR